MGHQFKEGKKKRKENNMNQTVVQLLPPFNHDDVITKARLGFGVFRVRRRAGLELVCDFFKVRVQTAAWFPAK